MNTNRKTTRRQFLAGTAATFTILPYASMVRGSTANERLNLAIFGTMYNATHMLAAPHLYNAPIVALCDPDQTKVAKVFSRWENLAGQLEKSARPADKSWSERYRAMANGKGVKVFSDCLRLLNEMEDSLDGLIVSQYDHLHGVACGPALRAGIPVLSERPLGLRISEARQLRRLAAESGLPTTYRSPGTVSGQFRRAMELVDEGRIGEVREVHVWFKRGGPDRGALPSETQPVPPELAWNAWLGPLSAREYHRDWMAYAHWRETCSGGLGTFGPHTSIFPFMTLQLRRLWDDLEDAGEIRVTTECARLNRISFPRWERVRWELPARGDMPPVTPTCHHGPDFAPGTRKLIHGRLRDVGVASAEKADQLMGMAGSLLIGASGALVANDHSAQVTCLPAAKYESIETNRPLRIPTSSNIYRDWTNACRGEKPHIIASFDNGGPLSELLMLGNIATLFPEETLTWSPVSGQFTTNSKANEQLSCECRRGWSL